MMGDYGFPYMGSKDKIVSSIAANFPKADNFYDLFGGGASMTHYIAKNKNHIYKRVVYNDIIAGNGKLLKDAIAGKYNYKVFKPKWISRDEFNNLKNIDPYVAICWSFGNNQKDYLFGPDIEKYKRSIHNAVVFGDIDEKAKSILGFDSWPNKFTDIKKRRLYFGQRIKYLNKNLSPSSLEHLQRLERLQQLQQLQKPIEILSGSYDEVEIMDNSVIYCDIPYKATAKYRTEFNHDMFFDWAANIEHPVYISEYNITDDRFQLVYELDKRSQLNKDKSKTVIKSEKLYWNRKGVSHASRKAN